jgi:hypothetical protein
MPPFAWAKPIVMGPKNWEPAAVAAGGGHSQKTSPGVSCIGSQRYRERKYLLENGRCAPSGHSEAPGAYIPSRKWGVHPTRALRGGLTRELSKLGAVKFLHVYGEGGPADLMTKLVTQKKFHQFTDFILNTKADTGFASAIGN